MGNITVGRYDKPAEVGYQGVIALEWPGLRPGYPAGAMPGWGISVFDAATGRQIWTVTRLEIHASAYDAVTADVTMFADPLGQPVYEGSPNLRDGEVIYETFLFEVGEMRVRQPAPEPREIAGGTAALKGCRPKLEFGRVKLN